MMGFSDICFTGKCDVCGKDGDVACVASTMGPISHIYCEDCLCNHLEPYHTMVAYIASAGHFPADINSSYQERCRYILEKLDISEEQFINDVDEMIAAIDNMV